LVSAGNVGLVKAMREFEPSRGYRFATYARWWINNRIFEQVRFDRWPIRIPDRIYRLVLKLPRIERQLLQELGRLPTADEVARRMDIPVRFAARLAVWAHSDLLSLDMPVGENGQSTLSDFVTVDRRMRDSTNTDDVVSIQCCKEAVFEALNSLGEPERKVIDLRFGLDPGVGESSVGETAQQLGLTRGRVAEIELRALRRLRKPGRYITRLQAFVGPPLKSAHSTPMHR
jgi:RNA polymerase primary sigma factor